MKTINELISESISFIKKESVGKEGIVRKIYFWDEKKWLDFYKPDDFGDHVPFICVSENNTSFALDQLLLWKKRSMEGLPKPKHRYPLPYFHGLIYLDDYLDGLALLYNTFKQQVFLDEGIRVIDRIIKIFSTKQGFFSSVSLPFLHVKLPEGFLPTKPSFKKKNYVNTATNGLICEKMIDFGYWSFNFELVEKARTCIDVLDLSKETHFAKCVTNPAYAMLKSATLGSEKHKNRLIKLINETNTTVLDLTDLNAYCRLLIETSIFLNKPEYWESAKKIVFNLAKNKTWKTQMFEDDGEGDFANLLMILDKNREELSLLKSIYIDIINKYYLGDGIWKDYSPSNMQKTTHTKYVGGMLKYLVLYKAYLEKENLLSNKWLYISQDR